MEDDWQPPRMNQEDVDLDLSPDDPDYDLSEAAGYTYWEPRQSFPWTRWVIISVALLIVLSLLMPVILRLI